MTKTKKTCICVGSGKISGKTCIERVKWKFPTEELIAAHYSQSYCNVMVPAGYNTGRIDNLPSIPSPPAVASPYGPIINLDNVGNRNNDALLAQVGWISVHVLYSN